MNNLRLSSEAYNIRGDSVRDWITFLTDLYNEYSQNSTISSLRDRLLYERRVPTTSELISIITIIQARYIALGLSISYSNALSNMYGRNHIVAALNQVIQDIINGVVISKAATNIVLSNSAINENVSIGTLIGTLTNDSFPGSTYSLVAGTGSADNANFSISTNQLLIQVSPDWDTKPTHNIRIRATNTDNGALIFEKQFTITINDLGD